MLKFVIVVVLVYLCNDERVNLVERRFLVREMKLIFLSSPSA